MPITLRIQNDSGTTANANAYIDVDFFREYHEERGNDISDLTDDEDVKKGIVRGKDFMDTRFTYKGEASASDGSSAFPRYDLTDIASNLVQGISLAMKKANAEYALIGARGELNPTPTRDASGRTVIQSSERVGPISESKTFASGAAYNAPEYPIADSILKAAGYVMSSGTIIRG